MDDPEYDLSYSILADARGCVFLGDTDDVVQLSQVYRENRASHGIKHAIIVDTPIETALAFCYRDYLQDCRNVEVFCTYDAAMSWLLGEKLE